MQDEDHEPGKSPSRNKTPPPPPLLHSIPETRQMLGGIANATVYKLIRDGRLPTVRIGRRRFTTPGGIAACIQALQGGARK